MFYIADLMYRRCEKAHHTKAIAKETFTSFMPEIDCREGAFLKCNSFIIQFAHYRGCFRSSCEDVAFRRKGYL